MKKNIWSKLLKFALAIVALYIAIQYFLTKSGKKWSASYADIVADLLSKIQTCTQDFWALTVLERGYFSAFDLRAWKLVSDDYLKQIDAIPYLKRNISKESFEAIENFRQLVDSSEMHRERFNEKFIVNELEERTEYFDSILMFMRVEGIINRIIIDVKDSVDNPINILGLMGCRNLNLNLRYMPKCIYHEMWENQIKHK